MSEMKRRIVTAWACLRGKGVATNLALSHGIRVAPSAAGDSGVLIYGNRITLDPIS